MCPQLIKFEQLSNKELKFIFDDDSIRIFSIDRMFQDDIPINQQYRWKKMFEKGLLYKNLYISQGEPVWKGWVELLDNEVLKYTEEYKEGINVNI